jgi:hypothetical protein
MGKDYSFLVGKVFGKLTVIEYLGVVDYKKKVRCLCECGRSVDTRVYDIQMKKSCGCIAGFPKDRLLKDYSYLVGLKFNMVFIKSLLGEVRGHKMVECICDCGKEFVHRCVGVKKIKSCGCDRGSSGELNGRYMDGRTNTPLYKIWHGIKGRVVCPSSLNNPHYGGKGVRLCEEWKDFDVFKEWALENGYKEGLSIERDNNNKDYEPSNCKWIIPKKQRWNTSRSVRVLYNGETKSLPEWCEYFGLDYSKQRSKVYKHKKKTGELKLFL